MLSETTIQNLRNKFCEEMKKHGFLVNKVGVVIEKNTGQFDLSGWDIQVPMVSPNDSVAQQRVVDCFHAALRMIL